MRDRRSMGRGCGRGWGRLGGAVPVAPGLARSVVQALLPEALLNGLGQLPLLFVPASAYMVEQ